LTKQARLDPLVHKAIHEGQVIPAHPLALTAQRKLDERRQRALTRYYLAAGAGGGAVGVHTTQFGIRDSQHGLLRPVLELAAETVREHETAHGNRVIRVAGICGDTKQAVAEATLACELGYDLGLLSLAALPSATDAELLAHAEAIGEVMPLFGFYLQPAVGGRELSRDFWRRFASLPSAVAIKIAPFDRYKTLDVVLAVAEAGRAGEVALYTGNDDNILHDLLTVYHFDVGGTDCRQRMVGGLLGHWAVWTQAAVALFEEIQSIAAAVPKALMSRAAAVTDANAAIFDAANHFRGCIAGINEVLRRQGFLEGNWCLDPAEGLSPGQLEEIDRVITAYPDLTDDAFVAQNLDDWLK